MMNIKIENTEEFWTTWNTEQAEIMKSYISRYTSRPIYRWQSDGIRIPVEGGSYEILEKIEAAAQQLCKEINQLTADQKVTMSIIFFNTNLHIIIVNHYTIYCNYEN